MDGVFKRIEDVMSAETYTTILDDMQTAFNTASPSLSVDVSYGDGLTAPELENMISGDGFRNVLIKVDDALDSPIHMSTEGVVKEGRVMMWSISNTPKGALDALKTWWLAICQDADSNIIHNIKTETVLGALTFMRWRAVGGFQGFASKYGNLWVADQLVEYTVRS